MEKSDTKLNKRKLEDVLIISCTTFFSFIAAIVENIEQLCWDDVDEQDQGDDVHFQDAYQHLCGLVLRIILLLNYFLG